MNISKKKGENLMKRSSPMINKNQVSLVLIYLYKFMCKALLIVLNFFYVYFSCFKIKNKYLKLKLK